MIEDIEGATSEPTRHWPTQASLCADGTRLNPPYQLMFDATSGRMVALNGEPRTGRSVPVALLANPRTGLLTVTCATSDISVPWETIAR